MTLRLAIIINVLLICVLGLKAQDTTVNMPITEYEHVMEQIDSLNNTAMIQCQIMWWLH